MVGVSEIRGWRVGFEGGGDNESYRAVGPRQVKVNCQWVAKGGCSTMFLLFHGNSIEIFVLYAFFFFGSGSTFGGSVDSSR